MIPVAAFAVTVTGASAFNPDMLEKLDVNLSDTQVAALEEVHELRMAGADREEIKTHLEDAGLDETTMKEIREAALNVRDEMRKVVNSALESDDFDAFVEAVAGTPLAEAITSETEFETFKAAHDLKESGDHEGARELMTELGIEKAAAHGGKDGHREGHGPRGAKMDA